MARVGMDVTVVRSDAAQMDQIANQLHLLVGSINASVARMSSGWHGADAEQLIHRWQRQSRPAIEAVAAHVHRLATTARNEAHAQDVTSGGPTSAFENAFTGIAGGTGFSGADALGIGGVGVVGFGAAFLSSFKSKLAWVTGPLGVPGIAQKWGQLLRASHPGRLGQGIEKGWSEVAKFGRTVAHGDTVAGAYSKLSRLDPHALQHASQWSDRLGALGTVTSVAGSAFDIVDAGNRGDPWGVGFAAGDGVSTSLKSSKAPTVYLAGVVVAEWTDVARAAHDIDWRTPLPAPTPSNLAHLYAPAFGDAVKQLPGHIWKWVS